MRASTCWLITFAGVAAVGASASADIVNGDFEAGNTGFSSAYAFRVVSDPPNIGQYGVTTTSFAWSNFWNTVPGDHTTGSGLFLIADTTPAPNVTIWQQAVPVIPGGSYDFSMWITTWTPFLAATVAVEINGSVVQTFSPAGLGTWNQVGLNWNACAATIADIRMFSVVPIQPGGDIAFDDIHFTAVPGPGAAGVAGLAGIWAFGRRRRA